MAAQLDVDLTMITRAYDEARRRNLLEGRGARGTYVAAPKVELTSILDLSMNMWINADCPWSPESLVRRCTTRGYSYRLLRRSRLSRACQAELVRVRGSYTPIELTLRELIELGCVGKGLRQGSRVMAWSHANGLADGDGSWSELSAGSTDFADYASAMSVEPTFTKPSFR